MSKTESMQEIKPYVEWTEKYRPKSLDDIVGNKDAIEILKQFRANKNFPKLLLVGDNGCGKTTAAYCLAKEIGNTEADIKELNASDDRGINVVRFNIPDFALTKSPFGAPFRVIILDECENLTYEAQMAFRRTMETSSNNCRFILIANDTYTLIQAIKSRCRQITFHPIPYAIIEKRLSDILMKERIEYNVKDLKRIAKDSYGDLRLAIETLQTVAEGRKKVDSHLVESVTSSSAYRHIEDMITYAIEGNLNASLKEFSFASKIITAHNFWSFLKDELCSLDSVFKQDEKARIGVAISYMNTSANYIDVNQVIGFLCRLYESYKSSQREPHTERD